MKIESVEEGGARCLMQASPTRIIATVEGGGGRVSGALP